MSVATSLIRATPHPGGRRWQLARGSPLDELQISAAGLRGLFAVGLSPFLPGTDGRMGWIESPRKPAKTLVSGSCVRGRTWGTLCGFRLLVCILQKSILRGGGLEHEL